MAPKGGHCLDIGDKIRNLRLRMGLTQEELAERSDLTKGFISQLEHDNTSPSVDTLENIVGALGTTMAEFFRSDNMDPIIFHLEDAFSGRYEQLGMEMHWIVPNAQKHAMEPVILELEPNGSSKVYDPFEGESFGFVLEGKVRLRYGEQSFELEETDCFYFDAQRTFSVENAADAPSKLLWVVTPPYF